ncbi:MAG: protein kinase [Anaerolineae bacterium]|nr:protein kinase [Anaerolineae bacterium]
MTNFEGLSIGRYRIIEQLGHGGMAIVYKAYDTTLEREVAIKFIRREAFSPENFEQMRKRFQREAKALAALDHPHIIKIYDYGEHEGTPYFVMQYVPSGTLKERTGAPMPYRQAAALLAPIARALAYAHSENILHRDIKPANILLTKNGQTMLSDFGVARILEAQQREAITTTGVGMGTPEYMSPEQGMGNPVDHRTDIYALGVVFYELVTGSKPFAADTPLAVILKHLTDPLPRPSALASGLPETVDQVIYKAMAKDPDQRYQSMEEFAAALEKMASEAETQPTVSPPAETPAPPQPAAETPTTAPITPETPAAARPAARWKLYAILGGLAALVVCTALGIFAALKLLRERTPASPTPPPGIQQPAFPAPPTPALGLRPIRPTEPPGMQPAFPASRTPMTQPPAMSGDCAGAVLPGAREKFTFDAILPCLSSPQMVQKFMANNLTPIDAFEVYGEAIYPPAQVVYEEGKADCPGMSEFAACVLSKHGYEAYNVGISHLGRHGLNVTGFVGKDGKLYAIPMGRAINGPFKSWEELAQFYIDKGAAQPDQAIWLFTPCLEKVTRFPEVKELPHRVIR